ncbi:MAG: hypothetical protein GY835_04845 [bacterium]|nr:hypothetical protein [bacterium]
MRKFLCSLILIAAIVLLILSTTTPDATAGSDCEMICVDGNFNRDSMECWWSNLPTDCTDCWIFCPEPGGGGIQPENKP